ncbi:MAG: 4-hydroxy-tetrahydrodipicolinate reductase [Myxococcota bacterium]|nr:4-hydroxy-tetrahydrodipicolinate reductase [Myxococcota bacterium]MEE2779212.1 4-hydroxy-tetrahydrodipicolinate reductase [Myxococcota bacterium]
MSSSLPILIVGASGRMGVTLRELAEQDERLTVAGLVDQGDDLGETIDRTGARCVVDFSVLAQVGPTLSACSQTHVPLVLGTTGLTSTDRGALKAAGEVIPLVWAPNFSVGANSLFVLLREATRLLGEGWDAEIVESHHRHKVDAPSGTARRLAEVLVDSREGDTAITVGREGLVGPRAAEEVGISVVRGGDVVGEHEVRFLGDGEQVVLTHRATDRAIFARGALRAARWLGTNEGRAPGVYDMIDVLSNP